MKRKRLLAFFLSGALMFGQLPASAYAAETENNTELSMEQVAGEMTETSDADPGESVEEAEELSEESAAETEKSETESEKTSEEELSVVETEAENEEETVWEDTDSAAETMNESTEDESLEEESEDYASYSADAVSWSEWSTEQPEVKSTRKIETKTQYSYRDKSTTTRQDSSATTSDGWTRDYSKSTTCGSWSSWQKTAISSSSTLDVNTRTVTDYQIYTMGHYCTGNVTGAKYQTCWVNTTANSVFNSKCTYHQKGTVKSTEFSKYYTEMDDDIGYYYGGYYSGKYTDSRCSNTCYRWYIMKTTNVTHTEYQSRPVYYTFYKWGNWSDYTDTAYTANNSREVRTRTLYRYADYNGTINMCDVTLPVTNYKYNGTERKPSPVVIDKDKNTLTEGVDYQVTYSSNVNAGTAYAAVEGITDQYYGIQTVSFTIGKGEPTFSFAESSVNKRQNSRDFVNELTTTADGVITYSSGNEDVAVCDAETGRITIKGTGTAVITASAAEGDNYVGGSATYTLSVTEPGYDPATIGSLSYSFANFGKKISDTAWFNVFGKTVKAKTLYKQHSSAGANGNCYGMAVSSLLFNVYGTDLTLADYEKDLISDLTLNDYNRNVQMTLESLIQTLFVSQFSASVQKCYTSNKDLNALCAEIKEAETEGCNQFPVLGIFGPEGGHALVGYKIEEVSDSEDRLYVYDCNYPNAERYITLKKNQSTGTYWGYSYQIASSMKPWTEANGKLTYIPYSVYSSLWINRGNVTELNVNTIKVNSTSFEIYDYKDAKLAEVVDGELITNNSEIYQFESTDILPEGKQYEDEVILYMPTDTYTFVNQDEDIFDLEISALTNDQSASVTTSADKVTMAVSDEEQLNQVIVDTENVDTYSISMETSYTGDSDSETLNTSGVVTGGDCAAVEMVRQSQPLEGELGFCNALNVLVGSSADIASGNADSGATASDNGTSETAEQNIEEMTITPEYTAVVYDGTKKKPKVTVQNGSTTLVEGTDYFVKYIHCVELGTASLKVYGIGKYTGSKVIDYQILKTLPVQAKENSTETSTEKTTEKTVGTPTLGKLENTSAGVKLSWTKVDDAEGYVIYRQCGKTTEKAASLDSGKKVSYTDKTAKAGKKYTYYVKACIGETEGAASNTCQIIRIAQPKKATVKKTSSGIKITWKKTSGAKSYNIYRKLKGGKWKKITSTKKLTYTDKKAKKKKTYCYAVQAVNGKSVSSYVSSKSVKR